MKTLKYITETQSSALANKTMNGGMPQYARPCCANEYHESDPRSTLKSALLYEETKLNTGLTQTLMLKMCLGETNCLCTCVRAKARMKGWGYALV